MTVKTSDMTEFKNMMKKKSEVISLDVRENSLKEDVINKIDIPELIKEIEQQKSKHAHLFPVKESKLVKIPKNLVLVYKSDSSGCGYIRCTQIFNFIDYRFGKDNKLLPIISSHFIFSEEILLKTRAIYFQRQFSPDHLNHIKKYKELQSKFKYKMIFEIDDSLWDWTNEKGVCHKGVPDYNFGQAGITQAAQDSSIEIMKMMDKISVSTDYLKHLIVDKLKINVPVQVNKNIVARYLWEYKKSPISEKIKKPKIVYAGSPTHYLTFNDKTPEHIRKLNDPKKGNEKGLYGDFENPALREFIIKGVSENKIEFVCFGGLPFFFEGIRNKIKVHEWYTPVQFHHYVLKEKADFSLMPLVPNTFNAAKSDLRAIESMACGMIPLSFDFKFDGFYGPYHDCSTKLPWDCSLKEIEDLVSYCCEPANHNRIIQENYDILERDGRYLESPKFLNEFLKML